LDTSPKVYWWLQVVASHWNKVRNFPSSWRHSLFGR
jgi:hypothetical protein